MRYEIFWKVYGSMKNEIFTGSDIVTTGGVIDKNDADTFFIEELEKDLYAVQVKNFVNAVNVDCLNCGDWQITKVMKLSDALVSDDEVKG